MKIEFLELRDYMITENLGVYEMLQELPKLDEFEQHNEYHGLTKKEVIQKINLKMQFAYGLENDEITLDANIISCLLMENLLRLAV